MFPIHYKNVFQLKIVRF